MANDNVAEQWREALKDEGYEHRAISDGDCAKLEKFSRVWRRILRQTGLRPVVLKVFEAGCGGGKHIVPFAFHGAACAGLDFSPEVLERAKLYIEEVKKTCRKHFDVELIHDNFLKYKPLRPGTYDIVFHAGVIEHFFDDEERLIFLKNMFNLTKSGGYAVSIVPSGMHPLREKMKNLKLGGYEIPEIDYTPFLMREEFAKCGGKDIKVLPHNIFGYLIIDNSTGLKKFIQKLFFYFFQLLPVSLLPYNFAVRHAGTLIGIARK